MFKAEECYMLQIILYLALANFKLMKFYCIITTWLQIIVTQWHGYTFSLQNLSYIKEGIKIYSKEYSSSRVTQHIFLPLITLSLFILLLS